MYDELVKNLRGRSQFLLPRHGEKTSCDSDLMKQAADAIEELQKDIERSKEYEAFWEKEANEALRKFQVAIASKPRWVPVTERLPKEQETVLTWGKQGVILLDWRHDSKWCCFGDVTHWTPLPQPPKESEP